MIKVSVMYPSQGGVRFDHDYYRDKHMPLVQQRMGAHCKFYTIDKGISSRAPGSAPPYVAMCHIFCDSIEAYYATMNPHVEEIKADIANYTDATPIVQMSEVVVGDR